MPPPPLKIQKSLMTKPKKIFLGLFITATLIYILPNIIVPIAKNRIQDYLVKLSRRKSNLGKFKLSLFTRSMVLEDLEIEGFLKIPRIVIKLELLPLLKKKIIISRISFDKPILILHRLATGKTNWDFLWQKKKGQRKNRFLIKELLIKDGIFRYIYELTPQRQAIAESCGVFIYLKNHLLPISYIQGIPLYTRIKGQCYIPTEPKGKILFYGNANLYENNISFLGNIFMENILLTYFSNFYPENSQIQIISGNFSLIAQIECIRNQLNIEPDVTVRNLQLKLTPEYTTGDIFELPVVLVVDFFDIYKEELRFKFQVSGSLRDPKFNLQKVITQKVSEVIGESIMRTITTSPMLIEELGNKLVSIADKLKDIGVDIGKIVGKTIQQLEEPITELIKGIKKE